MTKPYTRIVAAALAASLALGLAAVRFGPALAFSIELAVPSTERWFSLLAPEPARAEIAIPADGERLAADLYRPRSPRGAILLVHGLSRAGRRHPELVRLARLLGQHGKLVLVPQFEGLAAFRLSGREVAEVRAALRYLAGLSPSVEVAGFSFGAGPALLAAAGFPRLRAAGSFGGYADLRDVVAYVTTGVCSFDGRRYVRHQEPYNRWKLLALLAGFVDDGHNRALLAQIAGRKLADPAAPAATLERALGAEGTAVMALVANRDAAAVTRLLDGLPARARRALDRLSPLPAVPRLAGSLLLAHGVDDDSIPFTESLRLARADGGRARVAILRTFGHAGPEPLWRSLSARAGDAWQLFRLVDALLRD